MDGFILSAAVSLGKSQQHAGYYLSLALGRVLELLLEERESRMPVRLRRACDA